jgi:hypothetical protein
MKKNERKENLASRDRERFKEINAAQSSGF